MDERTETFTFLPKVVIHFREISELAEEVLVSGGWGFGKGGQARVKGISKTREPWDHVPGRTEAGRKDQACQVQAIIGRWGARGW